MSRANSAGFSCTHTEESGTLRLISHALANVFVDVSMWTLSCTADQLRMEMSQQFFVNNFFCQGLRLGKRRGFAKIKRGDEQSSGRDHSNEFRGHSRDMGDVI